MTFGESDLAALAAVEEVEIETAMPEGQAHRTIIWAVVRDGSVFIRSVNGAGARWFREALANPQVKLAFGGRRLAARATRAADPDSVAACSAGLRAKYRGDPSLASMLKPEILETTLRVVPP